MPVVPEYKQSEQMGALPSFRVQPVANENTFGAGLAQAVGNAGDEAFQIAVKEKNENDAKAVLDASSAYKNELAKGFNGDNGFYSLNGDLAKNVADKSNEYIQQTREKFMANLSKKQQTIFASHVAGTEEGYYKGALVHQQQQGEVAFENSTNANIETSGKLIRDNYKNDALVGAQFTNLDQYVTSFGIKKGWDETQIKNKQIQVKSQAVNDAFSYAINSDKLDDAKRLLDVYGPTIDKKNYGVMQAVFREKTEKLQTKTTAKDIVNSSGSLQEALGKIGNISVPNTSSWSQTKELVSLNESGGDPTAQNGDSGASGKYQFMPGTWKSIMGDAPMTPENQEIAFEKKYKPIYDKYGTTGVLVAVYAGDQNAERYANGQPLIGDNGNEYSADDPQYSNGNKYPSVNEYVQKGLGSGQGPLATAEYQQKLTDQVKSEWGVKQAIKAEDTRNKMDGFELYLTQNKPKSIDEIESAATNFGFTGGELISAISKGKQNAGLLKIEESQGQDEAYKAALQDIYSGEIKDKQNLEAKYAGTVGVQHLIALSNFLETTVNKESKVPIELQNKDNLEAFNGVIKESNLDKTTSLTEKSRVMEKVIDQIKVAKQKGIPVGRDDIEQWTREQTQKIAISRTWYGGSNKIYTADVPNGWSIDDEGPVDPNGVRPDKFTNGKFYITRNGVDIEMRE